jgi:DNA recombination protein RmuC
MASGIAALLVISTVTLHRFEVARRRETARLQQALADIQAATRDTRDESAWSVRALRDEIAGGFKSAGEGLARGLGDLGARQQRQADALSGRLCELTEPVITALRDHPMTDVVAELRSLAAALEARLENVGSRLDLVMRQIQADIHDSVEHMRSEEMGHAKDLRNDMLELLTGHTEQVRTAVDEKLEDTLERRLGEHFNRVGDRLQLVSERLDQVDRSLGDVQTVAAGLGDLQRALADARLGGTKTRARAVGGGDATAVGSRRAARKPRRLAADDTDAADDTGAAAGPSSASSTS